MCNPQPIPGEPVEPEDRGEGSAKNRENPKRSFDAFLCHVSRLDGELVRTVRDELHRLARRPFQLRALRVFVDHANVSAGELPTQIESALGDSRFLVVFVRPQLAERPWCRQEIRSWLRGEARQRLLLVLTAGADLLWDAQECRLRFADGAPLPEELSSAFRAEPGWVDLRPFTAAKARANPEWLREVARIAVPIHGFGSVDELLGRDHTEQRRLLRLRNLALVLLSLLAIGTSAAAFYAHLQRAAAERRARESEGRAFAAQAQAETGRDPVIALRLASRALAIPEAAELPEVLAASVEALDRGRLLRRLEPPVGTFGDVRALVQSPDGRQILVVAQDRAWLLDPAGRTLAPAIALRERPLVPRGACATADGSTFLIASGHDPLQGPPITGVTVIEIPGLRVRQLGLDHQASLTAAGCGKDAQELWVGDREGRVYKVAGELEPTGIQTEGGPVVALQVYGGEVVAVSAPILQEQQQLGRLTLGPGSAKRQSGPVLGADPLLATAAALRRSDGTLAVATGEGPIQLFASSGRLEGFRRVASLNGHRGAVRVVQWIGDLLASGGDDGTIRLWRQDGTELMALRGHRAAVRGLLWREEEKEIWSAGSDGAVLIWSLPELAGASERTLAGEPAAWSPGGERGEVAGQGALWRLPTGAKSLRLEIATDLEISALATGKGETFLAGAKRGPDDSGSQLFKVALGGTLMPWAKPPKLDLVLRMRLLEDGSILAGGGYREGRLRLASPLEMMRKYAGSLGVEPPTAPPHACGLYLFAPSGQLVHAVERAHEESVLALALAGKGGGSIAFASGGADGRVRLWDRNLRAVGRPWSFFSDSDSESPSAITSLAFSPDRGVLYVATASGVDAVLADLRARSLVAVRVATGERLWTLRVTGGDVAELEASGSLVALRVERGTAEGFEGYLRFLEPSGSWVGPELLKGAPPLLALGSVAGGDFEALDSELRIHRLPIAVNSLREATRRRLAPALRHEQALELATRAERAERAGKPAAAIQFLDAALRVDPGSANLHSVRGRLRLQAQDFPGALADYDAAIRQHPFLVTTRLMRCRARYASHDLAGAELDADAAVRVARSYFGRSLRPEGLPPGLLEINAAAAQAGDSVNRAAYGDALESRAGIRLARGRPDAAWADLDEAVQLGRKTPSLFAMRAHVLDLRGDKAGAALERKKMDSIQ